MFLSVVKIKLVMGMRPALDPTLSKLVGSQPSAALWNLAFHLPLAHSYAAETSVDHALPDGLLEAQLIGGFFYNIESHHCQKRASRKISRVTPRRRYL